MVLHELMQQLESSENPVAKALRKGDNFKLVAIGFKKGMILKEHKAPLPSKLMVLSGAVVYREGESRFDLGQYDQQEIPVGILHSVEAVKDSLCMLVQGGE